MPDASSSSSIQQQPPSVNVKPRRYRKAVSCSNCRLKKVKCDRTVNCSSCRVRGETCVWEDGAVPKQEPEINLEAEVTRLQETVSTLTDRIDVLERLLSVRMRDDIISKDLFDLSDRSNGNNVNKRRRPNPSIGMEQDRAQSNLLNSLSNYSSPNSAPSPNGSATTSTSSFEEEDRVRWLPGGGDFTRPSAFGGLGVENQVSGGISNPLVDLLGSLNPQNNDLPIFSQQFYNQFFNSSPSSMVQEKGSPTSMSSLTGEGKKDHCHLLPFLKNDQFFSSNGFSFS